MDQLRALHAVAEPDSGPLAAVMGARRALTWVRTTYPNLRWDTDDPPARWRAAPGFVEDLDASDMLTPRPIDRLWGVPVVEYPDHPAGCLVLELVLPAYTLYVRLKGGATEWMYHAWVLVLFGPGAETAAALSVGWDGTLAELVDAASRLAS